MSLQIRYLLHGQADKYDSKETLYIISKSDSLWTNLAQQVLSITNESWRLINPALSELISEEKFVQLGITVPKRENCTLRLKPVLHKHFSDTYFL